MSEYICTTDRGRWKYEADADIADAMRVALFLCWRYGEQFRCVEFRRHGKRTVLRIAVVEPDSSHFSTL